MIVRPASLLNQPALYGAIAATVFGNDAMSLNGRKVLCCGVAFVASKTELWVTLVQRLHLGITLHLGQD